MKTFFKKKHCDGCGADYDAALASCPTCGARAADLEEIQRFSHHVHLSWVKQLLCFLIGWAGFQLIGTLIQMVVLTIYTAIQSGTLSGDELTKAASSFIQGAAGLCLVNSISYLILFGILFGINAKSIKEFGKPFANWRSYLFGFLAFLALYVVSLTWSVIEQVIDPSIGQNQNQTAIIAIMQQYPWAGFIVFGIFGPLCEEITYRVGLFSLLSRWHKVAAYLITIFIFGAIHFGWSTVFKDPSQWGQELLAFPSYIFAGGILCFFYDKYGFGASALAHMSYNLVACAMTLIQK